MIRLYTSSLNIKQKVMIKHFFRMLGFYVETLCKIDDTINKSDVYIHVIDDDYVRENGTQGSFKDESNTILVMIGNWNLDSHYLLNAKLIKDKDDNSKNILKGIIQAIGSMIDNGSTWAKRAENVLDIYIKYDIIFIELYALKVESEELYEMATKNLVAARDELSKALENNPVAQCAYTRIRYEINKVCKINGYQYGTEGILKLCNERINKTWAKLLKADIQCELDNDWYNSINNYDIPGHSYCYYRVGRIYTLYIRDYNNAIKLFNNAIKLKSNYYKAMYMLGIIYSRKDRDTTKENYDPNKAIEYFKLVIKTLQTKRDKHLLSLTEMEYMYKSYMCISNLYSVTDKLDGLRYKEAAKSLKTEALKTLYLEEVEQDKSLYDVIISNAVKIFE